MPFWYLGLFPICSAYKPHQAPDTAGRPVSEQDNNNHLTYVQDSLFGSVLAGVPVFPILQLLVSALIFPKDNHDNTLQLKQRHGTIRPKQEKSWIIKNIYWISSETHKFTLSNNEIKTLNLYLNNTSPFTISPPSPVQYCPAAAQSLPWYIAHYWMCCHQAHVTAPAHSPALCLGADIGMIYSWSPTVSRRRIGPGSSKPWVLLLAAAAETCWPPDSTGNCHCKNMNMCGNIWQPSLGYSLLLTQGINHFLNICIYIVSKKKVC